MLYIIDPNRFDAFKSYNRVSQGVGFSFFSVHFFYAKDFPVGIFCGLSRSTSSSTLFDP
jgi:hypothetical protein